MHKSCQIAGVWRIKCSAACYYHPIRCFLILPPVITCRPAQPNIRAIARYIIIIMLLSLAISIIIATRTISNYCFLYYQSFAPLYSAPAFPPTTLLPSLHSPALSCAPNLVPTYPSHPWLISLLNYYLPILLISCAFPAAYFLHISCGLVPHTTTRGSKEEKEKSERKRSRDNNNHPSHICLSFQPPTLYFPNPSHAFASLKLDLPYAGTDRRTSSLSGPRWEGPPSSMPSRTPA